MPDHLTDLSPASLAVAIKTNLYAFFQHFRYSSVAEVHERPDALRWHTAIAHPWFNGMLSNQPPADETTELARSTIAYFESRAAAGFTWWLAPQLDPAPWSRHLLPLGFRYDQSTPGMAIDLAALPQPNQAKMKCDSTQGEICNQQMQSRPSFATTSGPICGCSNGAPS